MCAVTVGRSASYIMVDDFASTPAVARDALAWRGLGPTTRAFAAIDGEQCRTVVVSNECASANWSAMNLHNVGPRRDGRMTLEPGIFRDDDVVDIILSPNHRRAPVV